MIVPKNEIQSYRDLRVWQKGMDLAEACYSITKEFPKEEMYGMTSQCESFLRNQAVLHTVRGIESFLKVTQPGWSNAL